MKGKKKDDFNEMFPSYTYNKLKEIKINPRHHIAGKGFLKRGAACLLTGGTGIGKSVLTEQICVDVATGQDILGKIEVKKPQRVLFLEAENDEEILKQDFVSIVEGSGADHKLLSKNLTIKYVPGLPSDMFGNMLEYFIKDCKPDLLCIDPYQAFIGTVDINSTEPFFKWRTLVEGIIQDYGVALLLATHTPKPRDRKDWNAQEMIYLQAGTSAMSNWARTGFELMTLAGEDTKYHLHFSKSPARTGMRDSQNRIIRDLFIQHSGNPDKPYWKLAEKQIGGIKVDKKESVRNAMIEHPEWKQGDIATCLRMSKSTVCRYIKEIEDE